MYWVFVELKYDGVCDVVEKVLELELKNDSVKVLLVLIWVVEDEVDKVCWVEEIEENVVELVCSGCGLNLDVELSEFVEVLEGLWFVEVKVWICDG